MILCNFQSDGMVAVDRLNEKRWCKGAVKAVAQLFNIRIRSNIVDS